MIRQFGHSNLEPGLDVVHDLLIAVRRLESNRKTLCTEATSSAEVMLSELSLGMKNNKLTQHDASKSLHLLDSRS